MDIRFFDDPLETPRAREEVRIREIAVYVYPDTRRVAYRVLLTPFLERPSIEVLIDNSLGERVGSLHVIDTITPDFSLTIHLRDPEVNDPYTMTTNIYYATPDTERVQVDARTVTFNAAEPGERRFAFDEN